MQIFDERQMISNQTEIKSFSFEAKVLYFGVSKTEPKHSPETSREGKLSILTNLPRNSFTIQWNEPNSAKNAAAQKALKKGFY